MGFTIWSLFVLGMGYLLGYVVGWHKAKGNVEAFQPPVNQKFFK